MSKNIVILLLILFSIPNKAADIIVAGKPSGGRLGDNILLYCKAKYFSFKYKKPLVCRDFPFFNRLTLSVYENLYTNECNLLHPRKFLVSDKKKLKAQSGVPTIFEIDYFCKMRKEEANKGAYVGCGEFPFDWIKKKMAKYPEFGDELRRNLQVVGSSIAPMLSCADCYTVAVSTRMGSGRDVPTLASEQFFSVTQAKLYENKLPDISASDVGNPFKFVPQQFYIEQVKRLSELLHHRPMHIYFFIDKDGDFAEDILWHWHVALAGYKNITIKCNVEKRREERILDDLDLMSKCDILIRGCSHFAGIAQLAGQHKIIMGPDPVSAGWFDGTYLVFKKTFIYFQNIKEHKFEQYVFEETEEKKLQKLVAEYCYNAPPETRQLN